METPVAAANSQPQSSARKTRVLVVEDERHIARYLEFVLKKEGYEVALAYDGQQALKLVEEFEPDALLLDLVIPLVPGMEVVQRMRADPRRAGLVIIILSARSSLEDAASLAAAQVQAHCPKPVAPSTLLKKLAEFAILPASRP